MTSTTLLHSSIILHATSKTSSCGSTCTLLDGSGGKICEMAPAPTLVGVHFVGTTSTGSGVGCRVWFPIHQCYERALHRIWWHIRLAMISVGRLPTLWALFSHLSCIITCFYIFPPQFCKLVYLPSGKTKSTFASQSQKSSKLQG